MPPVHTTDSPDANDNGTHRMVVLSVPSTKNRMYAVLSLLVPEFIMVIDTLAPLQMELTSAIEWAGPFGMAVVVVVVVVVGHIVRFSTVVKPSEHTYVMLGLGLKTPASPEASGICSMPV